MEIKDFNKVIEIIEERDRVKMNVNISPFKNTIYMYSTDCESELYIKDGINTLIISRVQFKNTRIGIMTEVLKELIDIAKLYGCDKIKIQSVLTKEMRNFCIKNKFKQLPDYFGEYHEYMGDYELLL